MPRVLFLGPCHKLQPRSAIPYPPFAENSRSGRFLRRAIDQTELAVIADVQFDNILPGPALDDAGKERYPTWHELADRAQDHRLWQLRAKDVIVALSVSVARALHAVAARRPTPLSEAPQLVGMPHPSYMLRRPATEREEYALELRRRVLDAIAGPSPDPLDRQNL